MRRAAAVTAALVAAALGGASLGSEFNHRPSALSRRHQPRRTSESAPPAAASIVRSWRLAVAASPVVGPLGLPMIRGMFAGCGLSRSRLIVVDGGRGVELHAQGRNVNYLMMLTSLQAPQPTPLLVEVRDDERLVLVAAHLHGRPVHAWVSPRLLGVTNPP